MTRRPASVDGAEGVGQQGGQNAGGGWYEREGQAMQCQVCDTPYMTAASIGLYCPDLECDSHVRKSDHDLEVIDQFEVRRRQRDGKVFAGMPDAALRKLRTLFLADCKRTEAVWRLIKGLY